MCQPSSSSISTTASTKGFSSSTLRNAAQELETLRKAPLSTTKLPGIPPNCLRLLRSIPGNTFCVDCLSPSPSWACVTYGSLVCLQCSGRHRSYGVNTSVVRNVSMDAWTHEQVLAMLEGGNFQLEGFFDRHDMGRSTTTASIHTSSSSLVARRYQTKAAKFYKQHLQRHVEQVQMCGAYQGREVNRQRYSNRSSDNNSRTSSNSSTIEQRQDVAVQAGL